MSGIKGYYRILKHSKEGKLLFDSGLKKSNSFVIQFLQNLYTLLRNINSQVIDINNTSKTIPIGYISTYYLNALGGDDDATSGIVVGSGTNAESNTNYALQTQIAHGTSAGKLDYGASSFTAPAVVGANIDLVISRAFYNGSGGNVSVNEIGIYCKTYTVESALDSFCIIRDLLASTQVVANGETLTIQYTLRTTV